MNKRHALINEKSAPYVFLLPFILFFLIFKLWPIIWSFFISFFKYDGNNPMEFIGLNNYIELITNPTFQTATWNTIYFVVLYNIILILLSIFLSVLVSSSLVKFKKFYRSVFFVPIAMSLPVVAMVFDLLFARNIGFISAVFTTFGKTYNIRWFADLDLAMWGILIMRVWRGFGYYCAYFLAAMTSIPDEVYESAKIDGANASTTFFRITMPLLKPMILFVAIMSTILAFQIFDEPWIIAQGGPANRTLTLQIFLYQTTFLESSLGKGSAVAYLMTILMMGTSVLYVKKLGEKEGK